VHETLDRIASSANRLQQRKYASVSTINNSQIFAPKLQENRPGWLRKQREVADE